MNKKPEPAPAGKVERVTYVTREGGTVIVNPPAEPPAPKESENAEDPGRPAGED